MISEVGTDYYLCVNSHHRFHKECVESPLQIRHPFHPKHSLQLYFSRYVIAQKDCFCCGKEATDWVYHCDICDYSMHMFCATKTVPIVIDQPKRHHHPLTRFPRQDSLTCNVCGLINKLHPTYVCPRCDLVAHSDCIYFPFVIRISRHDHRVSFKSSLPSRKWSCGVCRRKIDSDYGTFSCNKCDNYAVHPRCALRKDVWDGKELEGIAEEADIMEQLDPFERIGDGIILHFSHDHHLRLETSIVYDDQKLCEACVLPIYKDDFYSCMECDFILHETCANAPRRKQHALHSHPLTLKVVGNGYNGKGFFECEACRRDTCGFVYECCIGECCFRIDVRCATVSELFDYQNHEHPLFMVSDPREAPECQVCKADDSKVLICIECDFVLCFNCATLPYMARYKHDTHYLTFCHGDRVSASDWCEVCEGKLAKGGNYGFYKCKDCCTTLHIPCLFGSTPYLKSGHKIFENSNETSQTTHILRNRSLSRPCCNKCHRRCPDPIFLRRQGKIFCSLYCSDLDNFKLSQYYV